MTYRTVIGVMVACAALSAQAHDTTPAQNVQLQHQEIAKGDPARWHREDTTTAEQARTLRKEIGAALAEARLACKQSPAAERGACLKEAQDTYQRDLANVPQILAQNR
jgi:hypothetical protein